MRNPIIALSIGAVLAGCTSAEQKQDYRDAQVQVIGAQVSGRTEQDKANASARAALYQAMAEVAKNAPDSADAIAVAMAVASVQEEADSSGAIVQLHREQNEAVELTKAIAPALIGTIGTVAKSMSQLSIDDAIDAKRRAARKTKRHKKLKLRHYQIRRQREATGVPLVSSSSSSSSEDDSEEEYELNRTIGSMEENDRVWWPR